VASSRAPPWLGDDRQQKGPHQQCDAGLFALIDQRRRSGLGVAAIARVCAIGGFVFVFLLFHQLFDGTCALETGHGGCGFGQQTRIRIQLFCTFNGGYGTGYFTQGIQNSHRAIL